MEFFEPVLRADFRVLEMHKYSPSPPIDVPVLLMLGRDDVDIPLENAEPWRQETSRPMIIKQFSGNHFFILIIGHQFVD